MTCKCPRSFADMSFPVWECQTCGTIWSDPMIFLQANLNRDAYDKAITDRIRARFDRRSQSKRDTKHE